MYETPPCPSCALEHVVCMVCKSDKPKGPSGEWSGSWWYCGSECLKTPAPPGEMCKKHREALESLKLSHPDMFRR